MVALLETKKSDHTPLHDEFPFFDMLEVPAVGHTGGIVIFWYENLVTLNLVSRSHQEIHATLQVSLIQPPSLISILYASTSLNVLIIYGIAFAS